MYRIEISSFEKYIDTFRYQQKIKRYDIISIYRPTLNDRSSDLYLKICLQWSGYLASLLV